MAPGSRQDSEVDLLGAVQLIHRHLDETLCEDVFWRFRGKERQRSWTLEGLLQFWTAVVVRAPDSLTELLELGRRGGDGMVPRIESVPDSFFQRCQSFPPRFFGELFRRFATRILPEAAPCYEAQMEGLRGRFPEVWAVDGSRLEAIAHRLKILRNIRSPVLAGSVIAFYDVFRGIARVLHFRADAAASEDVGVHEVLRKERIPVGTLMLGDRLYGTPKLFAALTERGLFALTRRRKGVRLHRIRRIKRVVEGKFLLEDTLVEVGSGNGVPPQTLRRIRLKRGRRVARDLLTNVLEPEELCAEEAVELYPLRWTIERMFFDLKEVLNLKRAYAANPNAVAMQLYATALVHTAFRVIQGRIAREVGRSPEELSPAKLFPRIAHASMAQAYAELATEALQAHNPGVHLRIPDWRKMPWARITIEEILVEYREGPRRRRRYCLSRRTWKSLAHVPGGWKLT